MALPDLTGQNIEDTYQRVLQTDGGDLRDGTGSLVTFTSITSSNISLGHNIFHTGDPDTSINFGVNSIRFQAGGEVLYDAKSTGLDISRGITSSADISSSGTITANAFTGTLTGTATGLTGTPDIVVGSLTATSITSSIVTSSIVLSEGSNIFGDASDDTHTFNGSITSSGNISSSGDLYVDDIYINNVQVIENSSNEYIFGPQVGAGNTSKLQGDSITLFGGAITASGNISSSGTITAASFVGEVYGGSF